MVRHLTKNPFVWAVIVLSLIVIIVTRFYALDTIPFGADGDVMWMSVDAADLVLGGVIPHYVDPVYAPDPVIVYLIGLSQILFGVSIETARVVTATTSLLTALVMLPMMWELLHEESDRFRLTAGIVAMMAVATSLFNMNMARIGHDSPVLTLAIALSIWSTASAWYRGGWWRWLIAGICLALTQYIYLTGRMMALVAIGWFIYTLLINRPQFSRKWRGWILMAGTAFVLLLPNIIMFVQYPSSFAARVNPADPNEAGFIWNSQWATEGRVLEFLWLKTLNIIQVTGIEWDSKQLPLNTPILTPIFFIGWCVGIVTAIVRIRKVGYGLVLVALPLLTLGDLVTSPSLTPTPMRHNQILPAHFAMAGIGLAVIWEWICRRRGRPTQIAVASIFCLVAFVPTIRDFHYYATVITPDFYENPANSGRVNQTDIVISNRIIAQSEQSYLLTYADYTRKTTAWLTLAAFPDRHSAVTSDGIISIDNLPEELVIVQSTVPNRPRHDEAQGLEWNRWWVLLHQGQTLYLPPLTAQQTDQLTTAIADAPTEDIRDSTGQIVATQHTVSLPDGFFTVPDYIPVDATLGRSLDNPEAQLLGYTVHPQDPVAGEPLYVSLYWQPRYDLNESYEIFVQLWDDTAQVYGESHELPYEATYRTRLWQPDEITVTHHVLFINDQLPVQRYSLAINFFRIVQDEPLLVAGNDSTPNQMAVLIDDFRVEPEQQPSTVDTLNNSIRFGELFEINQQEITVDGTAQVYGEVWELTPEQTVALQLQWDVLQRPQLDYSYFLHLMPTGENSLITQSDNPLNINGLPSGAWRTGDAWSTSATLQIPADIPSGRYDVWLGVYFSGDGSRLDAVIDGEPQSGQRLLLGQILIE